MITSVSILSLDSSFMRMVLVSKLDSESISTVLMWNKKKQAMRLLYVMLMLYATLYVGK